MNPAARPWLIVLFGLLVGCSDSPKKTFEGYKAKAEKGDALAQTNLGNSYRNGEGVAENQVQAVSWYRQAAEQGFAPAQTNLGHCYRNGEGVAKDFVQAVSWYRKAAQQGVPLAQTSLGHCYFNGEGVAKDEIEAYAYWNLGGITDERVRKNVAILEKKMSADQIADGKKRSVELQKEIDARIAAKKPRK